MLRFIFLSWEFYKAKKKLVLTSLYFVGQETWLDDS